MRLWKRKRDISGFFVHYFHIVGISNMQHLSVIFCWLDAMIDAYPENYCCLLGLDQRGH